MTKQQYKDSLADIAISPELIGKTKQLMQQKRNTAPKRTKAVRYASAAVCFAVVLFAVISVPKWISHAPFGSSPTISGSSEERTAAADIAHSADAQQAASRPALADQQATDKSSVIRVNQLGNLIERQPNGSGPMINRTEQWTFEQYCNLLGFDPLPTAIPEGLRLIENNTKNISFHDDRRLDFYNTWSFVYTSAPDKNAKSVTVQVNPSSIPYWSVPRAYQLEDGVQVTDADKLLKLGKKSEIHGTEVTIWHKDRSRVWDYVGGDTSGEPLEVTDYYCADFKYKSAGFTVTAQNGIIQDSFVQVLESIIK